MAKSNPATDLHIVVPSTAGQGRVWEITTGTTNRRSGVHGFAWESSPDDGSGFRSFDLYGCRKVDYRHPTAKVLNARSARDIIVGLATTLSAREFITVEHAAIVCERIEQGETRVRIHAKEVEPAAIVPRADVVPVANAIGEPERPRYGVDLVMHTDPGHGWLQVDVTELRDLGILDGITSCSYLSRDGRVAFLEEDGDLSTYCRARGWTPDNHGLRDVRDLHMDSDHWIRRLPPFHPRGCVFTAPTKEPA